MSAKIKGGYKNVSLKGVDLIGASPEVDGLYDALINSYEKPIQLCNIVIDGVKKKNAFVQVKKDGSYVIVENLYGYKLTIGSDNAIGVENSDKVGTKLYLHNIDFSGISGGACVMKVITYIKNPFPRGTGFNNLMNTLLDKVLRMSVDGGGAPQIPVSMNYYFFNNNEAHYIIEQQSGDDRNLSYGIIRYLDVPSSVVVNTDVVTEL